MIGREEPIHWILENDPSDDEARGDEKHMTETFKECFSRWPAFWRSLG